MRYFTEDDYMLFVEGEEYDVFFDDTCEQSLEDDVVQMEKDLGFKKTLPKEIYDEDGRCYINLEVVKEDSEDYISEVLSGMDSIIQQQMVENDEPDEIFGTFVDNLNKHNVTNSKIYPFVEYYEFTSGLHDKMNNRASERRNEEIGDN